MPWRKIVAVSRAVVPGIMDDLIPQFALDNEKFGDDYNNARTIVDTASHASPKPPPAPAKAPGN